MEPVVEAAKINREMFTNPIGVMINQLIWSAEMFKASLLAGSDVATI